MRRLRGALILAALVAVGTPALAQDSGRWNVEQMEQQEGDALFGSGATASSQMGQSGAPEGANGAPDVFPRHDVTARAWIPRSTNSEEDWLEVHFEEGWIDQIRVYETTTPGCIGKITDASGDTEVVLYETEVTNALNRFSGAHVFWLGLSEPRRVTTLRVYVRPQDAGFARPAIDAVGVMRCPAPTQTAEAPATPDAPEVVDSDPMDPVRIYFEVLAATQPVDALDDAMDWEAIFEEMATEDPSTRVLGVEGLAQAFKDQFEAMGAVVSQADADMLLNMMTPEVDGDDATVLIPGQEDPFVLRRRDDGRWVMVHFPH
jgi:hypothetical protein